MIDSKLFPKIFPGIPRQAPVLGTAIRRVFRNGYRKHDFLRDLGAGAVVGIVAIPLSMALAMAAGVPPQHGLYTAIVAGAVTALLGGSKFQVTGPTAAFVIILAPIVTAHGLAGLCLATLMAGIILYGFGLARLGRLIEFVPYPVTSGFTAGIAVVIATLQLKDALGLETGALPESFLGKVSGIVQALPTLSLPDTSVAFGTLALLVFWPRMFKRIPGPLVIMPLAAGVAFLMHTFLPGFSVATINSRFSYVMDGQTLGGIPRMLPPFLMPWQWPGATGDPIPLSVELLRELFPSAMAIAVLAAIESLLSAVIADGMTGRKHHPDAELMSLGLGNIATSFLGGFAATGAIARTAANIRFGARSPFAAITHSAVVLAAVVAMAPLLGYLPISALSALLWLVAWNMSEAKHFVYVVRISPKSDASVMLTCFSLTVMFDMVTAVAVGMTLASLLFIRRMAEVSSVNLVSLDTVNYPARLRKGVLIYEIAGPLFFGAAEKAMSSIQILDEQVRTVLFDFRRIPAMDITGLINLDSAVRRLHAKGVMAVLGGVSGQPYTLLRKAGWQDRQGELLLLPSFDEALRLYALEEKDADLPADDLPPVAPLS